MSNTLRNLMSRGGLSFAHLGRGSRASDENNTSDDKGKKGKRASDEDDDGQNRENGDARGSSADGDGDGDGGEGDGDEEDDSGKGKKGKKAKAADDDGDGDDDGDPAADDDDDEEEMRGKSAAARARRRERARCAAIFASKGAGRNPVLACKLAFTTSMTRSEAIEVLDGSPAPEGSRGRRQNPNLGIDSDRNANSEQSIAASWDVAFQKAGAKRRR
jgi:hypothetical protein